MKPKYKWTNDLADIRLLSPDIPEIREAVVRLWKYIDSLEKSNRDWPTDLHEQYLKVLDERDKLQEQVEYLVGLETETDFSVLGYCIHGVNLDEDFCEYGCRV